LIERRWRREEGYWVGRKKWVLSKSQKEIFNFFCFNKIYLPIQKKFFHNEIFIQTEINSRIQGAGMK